MKHGIAKAEDLLLFSDDATEKLPVAIVTT